MVRLPGGRARLTTELARTCGFEIALDASVVVETEYLHLGADVRIGPGVRIETDRLSLGDSVTIGAASTLITRELILADGVLLGEQLSVDLAGGLNPDSRLLAGPACVIGSGALINTCREVLLDTESAVSPRCMIFTHSFWQSILDGYGARFLPVRIDSNAWVGAGSTLLPGIRVGSGAVVMSNSTVIGDVPAETLVGGVPARVMRRHIRRQLDSEKKRQIVAGLLPPFAEHLRARGCQVDASGESSLLITLADATEHRVRLAAATDATPPRAREVVLSVSRWPSGPGDGTVFDLDLHRMSGAENPLVFEMRNFLRRFGIRFEPYGWRADYRKGM